MRVLAVVLVVGSFLVVWQAPAAAQDEQFWCKGERQIKQGRKVVGGLGGGQATVLSSRSASQSLMIDWRGTPRRLASRSRASTIQAGRSTFTLRCKVR